MVFFCFFLALSEYYAGVIVIYMYAGVCSITCQRRSFALRSQQERETGREWKKLVWNKIEKKTRVKRNKNTRRVRIRRRRHATPDGFYNRPLCGLGEIDHKWQMDSNEARNLFYSYFYGYYKNARAYGRRVGGPLLFAVVLKCSRQRRHTRVFR